MFNLKLKYTLPLLIITLLCIGGVEAFYYLVETRLEPEKKVVSDAGEILQQRQPALEAEETNGNVNDNVDKKTDISAITRRNLFASRTGTLADREAKDPLEGVELSSMAVTLMGTITGADEEQRAIIYDKKEKKQDLYQQGDFIYQAAIKKIMRGKVILNLNGKDEMLDISEARNVNIPKVKKPGVPITTAQRVVGRPVGSPAQSPAVTGNNSQATPGSNVVIPRSTGPKQLRSFRGGVIVKGRNTSEGP